MRPAALLGVGAIHDGETQEQGGQAGGMSIVMSQPIMNDKLILGFHVVSGKWLLQGGTVGGGSLNWFQRELFGKGVTADKLEDAAEAEQNGSAVPQPVFEPFREINEEAAQISEGSDGLIFLPYMAGERSPIWDIDAKGVFWDFPMQQRVVIWLVPLWRAVHIRCSTIW